MDLPPPRRTWCDLNRQAASDALGRFDPSGTDGVHERLIIEFVLVCGSDGEVGHRAVKPVAVAKVCRDRYRVARTGMCPRKRPTAHTCVVVHRLRVETLD